MRCLPLLLLVACATAPEATEEPRSAIDRAAWRAAEPAERHVLITLPAEVEPLPSARTHLAPRLPIRIVQWRVEPGDALEIGTPLATIQSPSLASLDAVSRTQRRLRDTRQDQLELGIGTAADLASAEVDLASAAAKQRDARSTVTTGGGESVWISPLAGVVGPLTCQQGAEIQPGTPCLTVDRPGEVRVRAWLPERYLPQLRDAQGTFTASDGRKLGPLPLVSREPSIDAQSRTVGLRFQVEAPELLAGTSGRLALSVRAPDGAFTVPTSALTTLDGDDVIFVQTEGALSTLTVQRLGLGIEPETVVLQGDLPTGAQIAWRGIFSLKSALLLEHDE